MPSELWYWEKRVPEDLIYAVKHIRDKFEDARSKSATVTQRCCYAALHPELRPPDEHGEYISGLATPESFIGPLAAKYFHDLLNRTTPSAILAAFFHFYKAAMAIQVKGAFRHLLEIGSANAERLEIAPIDWADWQVKSIINSASYLTDLWLKNCCDLQSYDPRATTDENIYWTNWRAPRFAGMQPSLGLPYDALRVWEREDEDFSRRTLKAFKQSFVTHLEMELEGCVGSARLELAKQPPVPVETKEPSSAQSEEEFRPSEDYCEIRYRGKKYQLTELAGRIVKLLHKELGANKSGLAVPTIKKLARCGKVWDAFRSRDGKAFMDDLIDKSQKGFWTLRLAEDAEPEPSK